MPATYRRPTQVPRRLRRRVGTSVISAVLVSTAMTASAACVPAGAASKDTFPVTISNCGTSTTYTKAPDQGSVQRHQHH